MRKLMQASVLVIGLMALTACGDSGGGGGGGTSVDPAANALTAGSQNLLHGTWTYVVPGSTNSYASGMVAILKSDGSADILSLKGSAYSNNASFLFRRNIGTYTLSGDVITLKYTYETCDPVGQESLKVKIAQLNPNKLIVAAIDSSKIITMNRSTGGSSDLNMTLVEDKDCNW